MVLTTNQSCTLIAEDLSAVSSLSMGVAIPVLTAFQHSLALLPTSVLSTQTEAFGVPVKADLNDWIPQTLAHWQSEHIIFNRMLIGYLGSSAIVRYIDNIIVDNRPQLTVFDPVMADQGALYPGLSTDYIPELRALLAKASITVPNLTEAQLLTNSNTTNEQSLLHDLEAMMPVDGHAIITDVTIEDQVGCAWLSGGKLQHYGHPCLPGHFYGSGDLFAALLTGFVANEQSLDQAIKLSIDFTYQALEYTAKSGVERRYGVQIGPLLGEIANYMLEERQ